MNSVALIPHEFNEVTILQRQTDGYLNATAACKACGKQLGHYLENKTTQAFLQALSRRTGIPVPGYPGTKIECLKEGSIGIPMNPSEGHSESAGTPLVDMIKNGPNEGRGTWVHPYVAVNMGQWANPDFAAQVSIWVSDWMRTGQTPVPSGTHPSEQMMTLFDEQTRLIQQSRELIASQQRTIDSQADRIRRMSLALSEKVNAPLHKTRRLTDEEKLLISVLAERGHSTSEVAEIVGRSVDSVRRVLNYP